MSATNGHQPGLPPVPVSQQRPIVEVLGRHFQPSPISWSWHKVGLVNADDGDHDVLMLCVLETVVGRVAIHLTGRDLDRFLADARQARSDLVVP